MRILVLGGSVFVGRHIVTECVRRGHQVTTLTRSGGAATVAPAAEHLTGDRRGDLACLRGRTWDAVIDTCGYRPEVVRTSVDALARRVGHYVFISSASVYPDHSIAGLHEGIEVPPTWSPNASPRDAAKYGPLKAACEIVVREAFPSRSAIIRPGLIVGPHDVSERFGYWPLRMSQGGAVLAPAPPTAPVQFIDVRDHASFAVGLAERRVTGIFNATSPDGAHTMAGLLAACPSPPESEVTWVDPGLLDRFQVRPWTELPLWAGTDISRRNTMRISTERAVAAGLTCRPAWQTIVDTLAWEESRTADFPRRGQLKPLKERLLIAITRDERQSLLPSLVTPSGNART